jgi:hypothetical protein
MCVYAQAIPCNIRLQFNKLAGDSVPFRINRQTYNVDVQKNQSMTRLGGAGWHQLVAWNPFVGAEMLSFSMDEEPNIFITMLNFDDGEEE